MKKGRVTFNTTIHVKILKEAKKLAVDLDRNYNDLFEEALIDMLKKHGRDAKILEGISSQGRIFKEER